MKKESRALCCGRRKGWVKSKATLGVYLTLDVNSGQLNPITNVDPPATGEDIPILGLIGKETCTSRGSVHSIAAPRLSVRKINSQPRVIFL